MRIAILILIHEFKEQEKLLIGYLSQKFDIYIHIDRRSKIEVNELNSKNIFSFKKYKVYWGDFSIVKSTVFLLKTALEKKYDRYMIISGSDIPLITNQSIYEFFKNNENEYIDCAEMPISGWVDNGGFDRIDYYYPKIYNRGSSVLFQRFFSKVLCQINQKIIIPILKKIKIHRKHIENIKYYGGSEWMDLTGNCVSQIISFLDNNKFFIKKFKYTNCSDEIFFQTLICNYVKNINIENYNLRYIDWDTGPEYPRTFRIEDYERLKQTDKLFARKFNQSIDNEIIQKLYADLDSF